MKSELLTYDKFLPELEKAITGAKKRLTISVMVAYADPATEPYFEAIIKALRRGVKVKIYLDRYSRTFRSENVKEYIKYGIKNRDYLNKIADLGGEVTWLGRVGANPFSGRIHQKVYLADDTAYVGGINFTFKVAKNDLMVKIADGKLVDQIENWLEKFKNGQKLSDFTYQVDSKTAVLFDLPGESLIYNKLCDLAKTAKNVKISSRMCPSGPVMDILATKDTKYYFNPLKNTAPTTMLAILLDRRKYGVKNSYTGKKYIHAKCALFDNKTVIVGSENFNYRGVKWNTSEMAVVTSHASAVLGARKFFDSL
jgi:phosphatidylserine/phosphatidylglycerophosphate/cardiolipin synthase-like enzyme